MNQEEWDKLIASLPQIKREDDIRLVQIREEEEKAKPQRIKEFMRMREAKLQRIEEFKKLQEEEDKKIIVLKDEEGIHYKFKGETFLFCEKSYKRFLDNFKGQNYLITINKEGYLSRKFIHITIELDAFKQQFHRWLKEKEIEEFANKFNLQNEKQNIHVHHIDENQNNNKLNNLEVLHKDKHAQKHGFNTWEELLENKKKKILIKRQVL